MLPLQLLVHTNNGQSNQHCLLTFPLTKDQCLKPIITFPLMAEVLRLIMKILSLTMKNIIPGIVTFGQAFNTGLGRTVLVFISLRCRCSCTKHLKTLNNKLAVVLTSGYMVLNDGRAFGAMSTHMVDSTSFAHLYHSPFTTAILQPN